MKHSARIFLMQDDDSLVPLNEAPYAREDLLQELLEHHPDLLAGEQVDPDAPRRWLFVTREMPVPGEEDGGGRWSLDHLFVDQDGVPTFVEAKRSSDPRVRREVVAQMLDYAANATAYWTVDLIRSRFEVAGEQEERDPDEIVRDFLAEDDDAPEIDSERIESFWERVGLNLRAGKIRMLFVADAIPSELRRIVEFLNKQMDPAEVLAVEVKQFVGKDVKALNSRVIGRSEKRKPPPPPPPDWNAEKFWAAVESRKLPKDEHKWLRWLYDLAVRLEKEDKCSLAWAGGGKVGAFLVGPSERQCILRGLSRGKIRAWWKHWKLPDAIVTELKDELARMVGNDILETVVPNIVPGLIANKVEPAALEKWIERVLARFADHAK